MDAPQGLVPDAACGQTIQERANERMKREAALAKDCTNNAWMDRETPLMITTQTIAVLETLGVEILHLDGKVSEHIGYLVEEFKPICVITNDTEFVMISREIPTTLLAIDFPWSALLTGWNPRRHHEASAAKHKPSRGGAPKPLEFRLFSTSKLMEFLSRKLLGDSSSPQYYVKLTDRQLWTVASLMGNDITGRVTSVDGSGDIYTFVSRIDVSCEYTYIENIVEATKRVINAATQGPRAYDLDAAGKLAVDASIRRYEQSALPKKHFSLDLDERSVYDAMISQKLPASYFIARRGGKFIIDDTDNVRLKQILVVVGHVLGLKKVLFAKRDAPDRVETVVVSKRPEVEECRLTWSQYHPTNKRPFAEKLEALALTFHLDPDLFTLKQSLLPPSVWLILWVLQPLCEASTYRHIVEMMVLVWLSEAQGVESPAYKIIEGLAHRPNARTRHPSVVARDIGKQFASAHCEVHSLLKLLTLDRELKLPAPADLFSGSVLHYLFCLEGPLDSAALDSLKLTRATVADMPRILTAIEVLASHRFASEEFNGNLPA
ncbi:Hypothetical protein, putative [Bodo saltans]|uniref:Uncharacterized protein n=1 Tax=Bodo saltans TaxID=75058 RepID=A0A0S4J8X3_BODSA|nr:Hypothetical protein, putative [Bodo saltans]|eukprot:CUG86680.1 Hypothetical protein, putative [Bodo saltans]